MNLHRNAERYISIARNLNTRYNYLTRTAHKFYLQSGKDQQLSPHRGRVVALLTSLKYYEVQADLAESWKSKRTGWDKVSSDNQGGQNDILTNKTVWPKLNTPSRSLHIFKAKPKTYTESGHSSLFSSPKP